MLSVSALTPPTHTLTLSSTAHTHTPHTPASDTRWAGDVNLAVCVDNLKINNAAGRVRMNSAWCSVEGRGERGGAWRTRGSVEGRGERGGQEAVWREGVKEEGKRQCGGEG